MKKLLLIFFVMILLSGELFAGDTKCDNQGTKCGSVLLKQPGVKYTDTLKAHDPSRQVQGTTQKLKQPGFKQSDVLKFTDPSRQLQGTDVPTKQPGIKYSDTLKGIIRSDERERDLGGVVKIEKKNNDNSNINNTSQNSKEIEAIVRVDNPTILIMGKEHPAPGAKVDKLLSKPNKESRKILKELQMNLKLINFYVDYGKCCGGDREYQLNKNMMNVRGLYDKITHKNIRTYLENRSLSSSNFKGKGITYDVEKVLAETIKDLEENGITDTWYLVN